jgi:hypothetical protein
MEDLVRLDAMYRIAENTLMLLCRFEENERDPFPYGYA